MRCRVGDMRHKEVINMKDGSRLGAVCDAEIDTNTASLTAIIIYGRLKFLGIMGREDDIVIGWKAVSYTHLERRPLGIHGLRRPPAPLP